MTPKSKSKRLALPSSPSTGTTATMQSGTTLTVPVVRHPGGNTTIRIETADVRGAERTFSVECAFVRNRHGFLEMVFVQLDPYDDTRIARVAVVRYTPERFIERSAQNEGFRSGLEAHLEKTGRGKKGLYTDLALAARPVGAVQPGYSALVEAELDVMMFASTRAAIIFLVASPAEIAAVARGTSQTISLSAHLEVTMSAAALADLLEMWHDLAEKITVTERP